MSKGNSEIALITGASGGIGAVYADRLAKRGYDLILVARSEDRLKANAQRIQAETGRKVDIVVADLSNTQDIAKVSALFAGNGAVAVLVNNAGTMLSGGFLQNDARGIADLVTLNVTAPTLLASAAAQAFAERNGGSIINIGSVVSFIPEMFGGAYGGSKAYLLNLSQSLSAQLKGVGVKVQAVLPGPTRTGIWSVGGIDPDAMMPGKVMSAEELVDAALVGFDRGETVTIPSLENETLWTQFEAARLAVAPNLAQQRAARRYGVNHE